MQSKAALKLAGHHQGLWELYEHAPDKPPKKISDVNQEKIHDLIDRLLKAIKQCFSSKENQQKKLSEILRIAYRKREEIFQASSNSANSNCSSKRKSNNSNDAEAPKS